jgi:hypothetical protein
MQEWTYVPRLVTACLTYADELRVEVLLGIKHECVNLAPRGTGIRVALSEGRMLLIVFILVPVS